MFYYSVFAGRGRKHLSDVLSVADPFALSPHDIVERVLANGCVPDLRHVRSISFRIRGLMHRAEREEQRFVVAVSRKAWEISVQEVRSDLYDDE